MALAQAGLVATCDAHSLIVQAPGVTRAGTRCARPVDLMHVYRTLADLAGLPAPKGVDGVSLRPLLKDPLAKWDRPAINTFLRGNHGVYTERHHYIRYYDGAEELYDRLQDPNEWVNLAARPGMAEVKRSMAKWLPENAPDSPRASDLSFDAQTVSWKKK